MRGGKSFQRNIRTRIPSSRLLIVCEGSKTEPGYFKALVRAQRLESVGIDVLIEPAPGTNPRRIVEYTIQKRDTLIALKQWDSMADNAWAVYDGVEHWRNDTKGWHEALDLAQHKRIHLAITNPSFELWYLLHFQDQIAFIERERVLALLRQKHIPDYEKPNVLYPKPLALLTDAALQRASQLEKLRRENDGKLHDHLCAEGIAALVALLLQRTQNQ